MFEIISSRSRPSKPCSSPQETLTRGMRAALAMLLLALPACDIEGCIADLAGLSPRDTTPSIPPSRPAVPPSPKNKTSSKAPPSLPPESESETERPIRHSRGSTRIDFTELVGFRASCAVKPECEGRNIPLFKPGTFFEENPEAGACVDTSRCTPPLAEIQRRAEALGRSQEIEGDREWRREQRATLKAWCKDIDDPDGRKFFECPPK